MLFECHLEDFVWHSICQVGGLLDCFGMLPDYTTSALCKFYCNGSFLFALVVLPLCNFFPVHFASLCHNNQQRPFKTFLEPNKTL